MNDQERASLGEAIYKATCTGYLSVEKEYLESIGLKVPTQPYCDWLNEHKLRQLREFKNHVLIERQTGVASAQASP